jgi:hypothetical protein
MGLSGMMAVGPKDGAAWEWHAISYEYHQPSAITAFVENVTYEYRLLATVTCICTCDHTLEFEVEGTRVFSKMWEMRELVRIPNASTGAVSNPKFRNFHHGAGKIFAAAAKKLPTPLLFSSSQIKHIARNSKRFMPTSYEEGHWESGDPCTAKHHIP